MAILSFKSKSWQISRSLLGFVCRSVMFYYENGDCLMNSQNKASSLEPLSNQTDGHNVDYFENHFAGCKSDRVFSQVQAFQSFHPFFTTLSLTFASHFHHITITSRLSRLSRLPRSPLPRLSRLSRLSQSINVYHAYHDHKRIITLRTIISLLPRLSRSQNDYCAYHDCHDCHDYHNHNWCFIDFHSIHQNFAQLRQSQIFCLKVLKHSTVVFNCKIFQTFSINWIEFLKKILEWKNTQVFERKIL